MPFRLFYFSIVHASQSQQNIIGMVLLNLEACGHENNILPMLQLHLLGCCFLLRLG